MQQYKQSPITMMKGATLTLQGSGQLHAATVTTMATGEENFQTTTINQLQK